MTMMIVVVGAILSYLVGSISFALIAGKLCGVDVRAHGSGNLGATNAGRVLGRPIGLAIFALDFAKGFGPAWLFASIAAAQGVKASVAALGLLFGGCAILGHVFPFYLGFKGGKGVATGAGVFFAVAPIATLAAIVVWALVLLVWRIVSLASLVAAAVLPAAIWLCTPRDETRVVVASAIAIAGLVVWRHRSNLKRIVAGTEKRLGEKA